MPKDVLTHRFKSLFAYGNGVSTTSVKSYPLECSIGIFAAK